MSIISSAASVLLVAVVTAVAWGLIELAQRLVVDEREAARDALEHEYELRLIDADALAKGLRAIDEAV